MKTKTSYTDFIKDTFSLWYSTFPKLKELTTGIPDYHNLADHPDSKKFGSYTINPKNPTDFSKYKVFIPDLSHMEGKKRFEVGEYLQKTYGETHIIPGIEFWQHLYEHPEMIENKENWKWYYLFGSSLCVSDGHWLVPCLDWFGGKFSRVADWLNYDWDGDERVVLLEIASGTLTSGSLPLESLDFERAVKIVKDAGYRIFKEV